MEYEVIEEYHIMETQEIIQEDETTGKEDRRKLEAPVTEKETNNGNKTKKLKVTIETVKSVRNLKWKIPFDMFNRTREENIHKFTIRNHISKIYKSR